MSEQVILWVFGVFQAVLALCVAAGVKAHGDITKQVTILEIDVVQRITRLEVAFELIGGNALKMLHKDDDEYEIDELVDEYIHNYDLPKSKWEDLHRKLQKRLNCPETPQQDKTLTLLALALCAHKLSACGRHADYPHASI